VLPIRAAKLILFVWSKSMTSRRRVGLSIALLAALAEGVNNPVVTWYVGGSGLSCKTTCEGLNQICVPSRSLWPINATGMAMVAHQARHVCHNIKVLDQANPTYAPAMRSVPVYADDVVEDTPSTEPIRYETTCYFAEEAALGDDPCKVLPNDPLRNPLLVAPGKLGDSVKQPQTWMELDVIADITLEATSPAETSGTQINDAFFKRFCPCSDFDVKWRMGEPGDSCTETCGKLDGICGFSRMTLHTDVETFKKVLKKDLATYHAGGATLCKSFLPRTSEGAPFIRSGACSLSAMNESVVPHEVFVLPTCDARITDGATKRFCPCYASPSSS